jgi:hypothetical protein
VALEELEAALAPMRLPEDLRTFWELVDAGTLRVRSYPAFHGPDFALWSWRSAREQFRSRQPEALVQVAYTSHQCMSVELDNGGIVGGAVFEWNLVDSDFERRFNHLREWLAHLTRLVDAGCFARVNGAQGPVLLVPDPDLDEDEVPPAPTPLEHPIHGTTARIGRDILAWPEHWQRAAGLHSQALEPRGATHSIATLLSSPVERELRATIAARVVNLAGGSNWTRVRVDDGTAALDVACPPAASLVGPRLGDWFEFDVTISPGERVVPADPDAAAVAEDDPAERVAAVLFARYGGPAGATAVAIRRLRPPA